MFTLLINPLVRQSSTYFLSGVLLLFLFLSPFTILAQAPEGFNVSTVQTGYNLPMGTIFSADYSRMFAWEKSGKIWVSTWNGSAYIKQTTPLLDISDEVGDWRDLGMYTVALDPHFDTNGRIYMYYVVDRHHLLYAGTDQYDSTKNDYFSASISRLTRYQVVQSGGTMKADPSTRFVLIGKTKSTGVPLTHEAHVGSTIVFGRDGTLLVSTGDNAYYGSVDGGSAPETYWQALVADSIMRPNENVGSFRAQVVNSLCGKILRIDPNTGEGLPSNPFYDAGNPESAQSKVWTLGFRNPFRMSLQPGTGSTNPADANPGTLLVGDVGWNSWEELNIIRYPGENAGWPLFEGLEANFAYMQVAQTLSNKDEPNPANTCDKPYFTFADLVKQAYNPALGTVVAVNPCTNTALPGLQRRYFHSRPVIDWFHDQTLTRYPAFDGNTVTTELLGSPGAKVLGDPFYGYSIIGGDTYTGTRFPAAYQNRYFFADYAQNWIKVATIDSTGLKEIQPFLPDQTGQGIVDLQYNGLDQSIYYVNHDNGEIKRISYGNAQPPVAKIEADQLSGISPLTVHFKGDNSTNPNSQPLTYLWDFGDSTTSTEANPTHVFTSIQPKGMTVSLTVKTSDGLTNQIQTVVSLNNSAPHVAITDPINGSKYTLDKESQYQLKATVTDDDSTGMTYSWRVWLRHNTHQHAEPISTEVSPKITISPVGCDGETYYYFIQVTVTDRYGLSAIDSAKIYPDCNSSSLAVSNVTAVPQNQAIKLTWKNPTISFDQVLVVAKEGSGFQDSPHETEYVADANFIGNGSVIEGGKVVYKGNGQAATITGLTAGKTYYFRIYTLKSSAWTGGVEVNAQLPVPQCVVTKVRIYPRAAWASRLVGGTIQGSTAGSAGPWTTLLTIPQAQAGWNEYSLPSNATAYTSLRYYSPNGGYCNVAEIEFYSGDVKLTGSTFGDAGGAWGGSANNYAKAFDGEITTFYDANDNSGAFTGLLLADCSTPPVTPACTLVATASHGEANCGGNVAFSVSLSGGSNGTTTYEWSGPGGFTSTLASPTLTALTSSQTGIYSVTVTQGDCKSTTQFTLSFTCTPPTQGIVCQPTKVRIYPRAAWASRLVGGTIQGSTAGSAGPWTTLLTIPQAQAGWNEYSLPSNATAYTSLRYYSPNGGYCNVAEIEFYSGDVKLTGSTFGDAGGAWGGSANNYAKAFDGDLTTFYDANDNSGAFTGLLLADCSTPPVTPPETPSCNLTQVRIYPRPTCCVGRTVGAQIQVLSTAVNAQWQTVFTVPSEIPYTWNSFTISGATGPFQAVRYVSPSGGYGNLGEIEFYNGTQKLSGTAFGDTGGPWNGISNTFAEALDGKIDTYYDGAARDGAYAGLTLDCASNGVTRRAAEGVNISESVETTVILQPNPTTGRVTVRINVPKAGRLSLSLQTLMGQPVVSHEQLVSEGENSIELDCSSYVDGLYLVRIQTENQPLIIRRLSKISR